MFEIPLLRKFFKFMGGELTCIVTYQNLGSSMGSKMTFQQGDKRLTRHVFECIELKPTGI